MKTPGRIGIILLFTVLFGTAAGAGELTIRIHGVDFALGGRILAGLYASEEGYPEAGYEVANIVIKIGGDSTVIGVFEDLPAGRYVVAILHDLNGNDDMDYGFLGIPKEGYGFSGVENPTLTPPKFNKAAVELRSGENAVTDAYMKYL